MKLVSTNIVVYVEIGKTFISLNFKTLKLIQKFYEKSFTCMRLWSVLVYGKIK